jgi:ribosomal protein S27AE
MTNLPWKEIRSEILRRDNKCCQVCGKPHSGQVHHVIPRSQGGSNNFDNLMTLCGKCHMLVSPVPDWLLTKVWKIPPSDISAERKKIQDAIDQIMQTRIIEKTGADNSNSLGD